MCVGHITELLLFKRTDVHCLWVTRSSRHVTHKM